MEMERPLLVLQEGMDTPHRWLVRDDVTTLGRWPDNDIVLPDRMVSRHHAQIRKVGSQFLLEDLESTNGTYVNGERITGPYVLQDGDVVQIAPRFQLGFVDSGATAPIPGQRTSEGLRVDELERQVYIGGLPIDPPLSVAQYTLLLLLMRHEGRVISREDIVNEVWAEDDAEGVTDQAIDALIRRLRERLAAADPDHQYIVTVRGHGFKFENR